MSPVGECLRGAPEEAFSDLLTGISMSKRDQESMRIFAYIRRLFFNM